MQGIPALIVLVPAFSFFGFTISFRGCGSISFAGFCHAQDVNFKTDMRFERSPRGPELKNTHKGKKEPAEANGKY